MANPKLTTEQKTEITAAAINLFSGIEHGHMGRIAYLDDGAFLFNKFVHENPDYYLYHDEIELFSKNCAALARNFRFCTRAFIVGPGPRDSFKKKEMHILKYMPSLQEIIFIDLSQKFNEAAKSEIDRSYLFNSAGVRTSYMTMDFRVAAHFFPPQENTAVLCTGSLISNLENVRTTSAFPRLKTKIFMTGLQHLAGPNGKILIGYDANNDLNTLLSAYNQHLEPFMINIMRVIRDHAHGARQMKIGPNYFSYEASIVPRTPMVEHRIVVKQDQTITLLNKNERPINFELKKGQRLTMMASLKPRPQMIDTLGREIGISTTEIHRHPNGPTLHIFST
ncbi:L-histidine N(alpha)-methyltransferase [Micavibrio aeruginosavorus]|uniref:L-histidine N(alpha)-methyltransferase n=1 Tax=Micavibrio aeruginosavorus TaxID=349221 RepID=UPI003F4A874F